MRVSRSARCVARKAEGDVSPRDFYPTPPWVSRSLALLIGLRAGDVVWEPACGDGAMACVLSEFGCDVIASDIGDYEFGERGVDFLRAKEMPSGVNRIITNPPFSLAESFCRHAHSFRSQNPDIEICFLVRVQFVEGKGRHSLFQNHPPIVCVYPERINFWAGELRPECNSAHCHAWFIWRPGGVGEIRWFAPNEKAKHTRAGDYGLDVKGESLPLGGVK